MVKMKLSNREWKEFKVEKIFDVFNSSPYHKKDLMSSNDASDSIAYITRTNRNNGLSDIVMNQSNFNVNPSNIIIFGAENATFFYQPFEHITGNKIYGMKSEKLNKYIGLFIQQTLNSSVKDCGFSYGQGLTGTREKRRSVMLPAKTNKPNEPDWDFMEKYIKQEYDIKNEKYDRYLNERFSMLNFKEIAPLDEKIWEKFKIDDICYIHSGKDIYEAERVEGSRPYITSTALNNGIRYTVSNKNKTIDTNAISVNRNGSVGYAFYHKYEALYSNDCRKLKLKKNNNEFVSLFLTNQIMQQKDKYNYGYKMGTARLKKQYITLPVNDNNAPDYEYMEQYVKNLMLSKYIKYQVKETI